MSDKKYFRFIIACDDDDFIAGPYYSENEVDIELQKLKLSNPNINYFINKEFLNENNEWKDYPKIFPHKCIKCGAQYTSELENDSYCGLCETSIEDETGESPAPVTVPTWDELGDDEPSEKTKELLEITKNPNILEPVTIPELKITEANEKIVYDMLVKPIIEKADEIINLLNGLNPPKAKGKKSKDTQRLFNIADDLVAHHYKQPKKEEKIVFTNRANTEYKLVKEDLLDLGYQENYKDIFHKGLDPIVSRDKPVFGLGRVLQPLNKTISAMKKSIDEATSTAQDRYNKHLEAHAKAKAEAEARAKAQTEAQGGQESANN